MIDLTQVYDKLSYSSLNDIKESITRIRTDMCCANCSKCEEIANCNKLDDMILDINKVLNEKHPHTHQFEVDVINGMQLKYYVESYAEENGYDYAFINNCVALVIGNDWYNLVDFIIQHNKIHFKFKLYSEYKDC